VLLLNLPQRGKRKAVFYSGKMLSGTDKILKLHYKKDE